MNFKPFTFAAMILAVTGCMTIFEAHEAQKSVAGLGYGVPAGTVQKVSLANYSLRELVDFAMTNRPSVISAALAVEDARLALQQIAADAPLVSGSPWTAPRLSMSGAYSASSESGKALHWHTEGSASAGLSLQVLLYDFGRNRSQANAQIERLIAAEYGMIREGYAVFEEVSSAYFELLKSDAMLEVSLTNEVEYATHLKQAKDRLAAGVAESLDVTRATLDLAKAREETIVASNDVITCGAALMKALGIEASNGVRDEVFPADGLALSAVMRGFADTRYSVGEAFDLARTNSPVMAVARAKLRSSIHDVDYAIADLLPSVSAEVGLSWADPLWAWHWGINAVQSLFQGFRKTTAVDRAVVAMRQAEAAVCNAEQQLSLEVETAVARRDNAQSARESARTTLIAARENFEQVKTRYAEGEASAVDFTDSVSYLATALGNRVNAFYVGQAAEAKLFALTGMMPDYREELIKEDVK